MNIKIEFKDEVDEDVSISYNGKSLWIERGNRSCVSLDNKSIDILNQIMSIHGVFTNES